MTFPRAEKWAAGCAGLAFAMMFAACQASNPAGGSDSGAYPAGQDPQTLAGDKSLMTVLPPSDAPAPQPGMASLSGALYSYTIQRAIPDTMFFLTPAVGDNHDSMPAFLAGPDPAAGDVAGRSDGLGNFHLDSVPPGNYFLIVSAPYNWCPAETSPSDPSPLLIRLSGGDRVALSMLIISWP
jgi:hypothetical protein